MSARTGGFRVRGRLRERETGRPLAGLVVRAYDEDLVFDDKLGFATSDEDGRFEIRFGEEAFRDVFESRPDLYLRVFDHAGSVLLHETRDAVRRDASRDECFEIAIPARALRGTPPPR